MNDLAPMRIPAPATIIIFGASGDLTQRKLIPALHSLACADLLPAQFKIVGVARTALSDEAFRQQSYQGVQEFGRLHGDACDDWDEFSSHLHYVPLVYDNPADYTRLSGYLAAMERESGLPPNRLFYLATPPELYVPIIEHLGAADLCRSEGGYSRIIVEKPFGRDLSSAEELNRKVHRVFDEDQVYRIDHYLGKETVQNIMVFRFANAIFEPLWNRYYIDHIQISVLEEVGVGRRGGYYDQAGVMRDMFQNHLMQLLSLTAMEPPTTWDATLLRDEKVKVLRAVRAPNRQTLKSHSVRGQYHATSGDDVSYRREPGVNADSMTPTYAALELYIDNWRWQGVPFFLRSGKALKKKVTELVIVFKEVPHMLFRGDHAERLTNILSFCFQPDEGFHLGFQTKVPGAGMRSRPVDMSFHFAGAFGAKALPEAYERLLLDALLGDAALFARADEIEHSWRITDSILRGWEGGEGPPLSFYEPGSWGPGESDAMLATRHRAWTLSCCDQD
ncbi:MAG: glucose-6-phosphate dehydrogenase [Caldilineales bacterium]|nr:glucose-6-phosphate dehydrogenase [Caldilineales bacterium]